MKVYIVTDGSYSAFRTCAVFSDKGKAEEYSETFAEGDIEEYELDEAPQRIIATSVSMRRDGSLQFKTYSAWIDIGDVGFRFFGDEYFVYKVATDDKKRAIKVVNEKRVILLVHNTWGDIKLAKEILGEK